MENIVRYKKVTQKRFDLRVSFSLANFFLFATKAYTLLF
jgi:hypothetical protein